MLIIIIINLTLESVQWNQMDPFILHTEELKIYKGPFGYQLSII